ncbi:MAG: site-2 protease family protein [Candidatus Diapherotrites archaeon]|nr:site-2 protease family protein [Candidatus Micrarchaeota archaeon]MBU1939823.1 site-2 protease family protein [Candidatus Micrarchaeota archaeon]
MSLLFWLLLFFAIAGLITWLIKRYTKHQTWFLISLVKTKKPLKWFDRIAKIGKPLDWFADLGIVLGFGAFATDYLWGRKMRPIKRVLFFLFSTALLTIVMFAFDIFLNNAFSNSPIGGEYFPAIAIVFGISGFAGFTLATLVMQALDIFVKFAAGKHPCPGVAPLIPGVEIPNVPIVLPLYAWIPLILILIIHESMHGILARRAKLKVKSTGMLLLGFLPIGAFVEPDESEVNRAEKRKALRLYSAGPMANIMTLPAISIFLLVLTLLLSAFVYPWYLPLQEQSVLGVRVASVDQNFSICGDVYESPAYGVLNEGQEILAINDVNVSTLGSVRASLPSAPFETATFLIRTGSVIEEKTLVSNELGRFGFTVDAALNPGFSPPPEYLFIQLTLTIINGLIYWLFILSLLIALVNFLPVMPFDGGRIAKIIFLPYLSFLNLPDKKKEKLISRFFLAIVLALFFLNALPLFI